MAQAYRSRSPVALLPVLTPLRGIAALLVVLFHFTGQNLLPSLNSSSYTMVIANGYLAVDLFFLMSGVVIAHVYGDRLGRRFSPTAVAAFMRARFARLFPLHFCTLAYLVLIGLVLQPLFGAIQGEAISIPREGRYSVDAALASLFLVHGLWNEHLSWNAPSWSISTEFFAYLAFPALALILPRIGIRATIAGIIALYAGLAWLADAHGGLDITTGPSFIRCLLQFAMGTLIYRLYGTGVLSRFFAYDGTFAAAAVTVLMMLHFDAADIVVIPAFIMLIFAGIHNRGRIAERMQAPALAWLGKVSYSIYLVHGVVDEVTRILFGLGTGFNDGRDFGLAQSLAIVTVMLAFVLMLSDFAYRRIEVPARRWLRSSSAGALQRA